MKRLILDIIKKYFPVVFVKYRYFKVFGKKLNLKNPTGFNKKYFGLLYFGKIRELCNVQTNMA